MCYAGLTKGTSALHVAVLCSAASLGVSKELEEEFEYSQSDTLSRMRVQRAAYRKPRRPAGSVRWRRLQPSFEHAGSTPHIHQGAAVRIYRLLSKTPLADRES